jgi:S-formylglutathione hydrolase
MAVVFPDTSPRGVEIAGHDDSQYDLGSGAGFYINATNGAWAENYNMQSYITEELPKFIE